MELGQSADTSEAVSRLTSCILVAIQGVFDCSLKYSVPKWKTTSNQLFSWNYQSKKASPWLNNNFPGWVSRANFLVFHRLLRTEQPSWWGLPRKQPLGDHWRVHQPAKQQQQQILPGTALQCEQVCIFCNYQSSTIINHASETQLLRTLDDTSARVFISTTLAEKSTLSASQTQQSLCNRETETTTTSTLSIKKISTWLLSNVHPSPAFTQPQCARSLRAAAWRSSTTRSSPPCSPSRSTTASRRCTSWPRCAPLGCPSSRAGALNTTGRTWRRLRVGSKCTFTDLSSGWTRCWRRWEAPRTSSPPSPSCPRTLCLISNASTIETKYQLWFVSFETFASYKVIFSPSLNAIKQFKCK